MSRTVYFDCCKAARKARTHWRLRKGSHQPRTFSLPKPRSPRFTQDDGNLYVIRRHSTVSLPPPILTPITLHKKLKKMPQSRRKGIKRCGKWGRSRLHSIVFLSSTSRHFFAFAFWLFYAPTQNTVPFGSRSNILCTVFACLMPSSLIIMYK